MKKVINIIWNGNGENDNSYIFNRIPRVITCNELELKEAFLAVRSGMVKDYQETLEYKIKDTSNYTFKCIITIACTRTDSCTMKSFEIYPKKMRP